MRVLKKVKKIRGVPSRGGITQELDLECGHSVWRAKSRGVPMRVQCWPCTFAARRLATQAEAKHRT